MKILKIDETNMEKTGYATMECEFTQEEINFFVEYAVVDLLRKAMKHENNFRTAVPDTE